MKKFIAALALGFVVAGAGTALARPVTLTTQLKNYGGNAAYVVIYITDGNGRLQETLWMAGGRTKYYRHLTDWRRAGGGSADGITGASVGSGQTLKVQADIADAMIDAGYKIHIDTAVENYNEAPSDVVAPLTSGQSGKAISGRGNISAFQFDM
jgi:Predicted periplasmic protein (DUF2271)